VTCARIEPRVDSWLGRLGNDLADGTYRPSQPRWVDIPKSDVPGTTRRLGILTVRDRVTSAALKQVLEPVLEPTFLPTSFGFRPGRSVPAALGEAVRRLTPTADLSAPFAWAAHCDVANCFDTIDHRLLFETLARHVADPLVLGLVARLAEVGGETVGWWWWRRRRRLVQGSSLSPLLCNLYLHPLDMALADLARGPSADLTALRYADDLLLLAHDRTALFRGIDCLRQTLTALRQRLRAGPTPAHLSDGVEWLGVILRTRAPGRDGRPTPGYLVAPARVARMLARLNELTEPPSPRLGTAPFRPAAWVTALNEQLRDWHGAYRHADNAADLFHILDEHCRSRVATLLPRITGLRPRQFERQCRRRLRDGGWTWEIDGVRLLTLTARPLACQAPTVHPPAWMR
jgi:hypothetical protein